MSYHPTPRVILNVKPEIMPTEQRQSKLLFSSEKLTIPSPAFGAKRAKRVSRQKAFLKTKEKKTQLNKK